MIFQRLKSWLYVIGTIMTRSSISSKELDMQKVTIIMKFCFFFQIDIDIEPTDKVNNNIAAYFVYNSFCRMICSAVSISSWNVFILCKNYIKLEKAYIVSGQFFYHPAKN